MPRGQGSADEEQSLPGRPPGIEPAELVRRRLRQRGGVGDRTRPGPPRHGRTRAAAAPAVDDQPVRPVGHRVEGGPDDRQRPVPLRAARR